MNLPVALQAGDIFPDTTRVTPANRLAIGGCDLVELTATYGTPLYVFDEASIRARARAYREALARSYPGRSTVCYAAKAYCAPWLLRLLADEGLGLDVVSGGELYTATAVDFPRERIYLHGNNKGADELAFALEERVGRIVLDNLEEIGEVAALAAGHGVRQPVLLRVSPGVDVRAHPHFQTGGLDTKFGLGIASGAAEEGVRAAVGHPELELRGLHAHIGSEIADLEPYRETAARLFEFARRMRETAGLELREISPGGGFGVRYTPTDPPFSAAAMIAQLGRIVADAARRHGFGEAPPDLTIEPGRALVATAAVALYRVGSVKTIPGVRTYVAVDGGMADNIRPAAYGAFYTAVLANRVVDAAEATVAVAGKYCESGDILIREARLPLPAVGDLVAVPVAGAYQLSMSSNYNMAPRPAVVVVADGQARLVRRRETYADLLTAEVLEEPPRR